MPVQHYGVVRGAETWPKSAGQAGAGTTIFMLSICPGSGEARFGCLVCTGVSRGTAILGIMFGMGTGVPGGVTLSRGMEQVGLAGLAAIIRSIGDADVFGGVCTPRASKL